MSESAEPTARHVTVKVWTGSLSSSYEDIVADDPDEYEMGIVPADTYYVPHDDHVVLADEIEHHAKYAFLVDTDEPVELHVETNDSYHSPVDGFTDGRAIEGGLVYVPEGHSRHTTEPFKTEIWGRIRMRVEARDE